MPRISSHVFRGKRYRIIHKPVPAVLLRRMGGGGASGCCEKPTDPDKRIYLDPNVTGQNALKMAVDEGIHACLWDLDNAAVDEVSESIGAFIWRLGYRLPSE